jgi:acetyl-CoA acetyltransferase
VSDPVIVATARSPIGRARKGSLIDLRADEMARQVAAAALAHVPELPVDEFEDLYLGVAHQVGEQAQNMARRVAVLLGRDDLPGATVSRACASSLLCLAMAANGVAAGAGDAYLAIGAESVSRYTKTADAEDRSPDIPHAAEPGPTGWTDRVSEGKSPTSIWTWDKRPRTSPTDSVSPGAIRTPSLCGPSSVTPPQTATGSGPTKSSRSPWREATP